MQAAFDPISYLSNAFNRWSHPAVATSNPVSSVAQNTMTIRSHPSLLETVFLEKIKASSKFWNPSIQKYSLAGLNAMKMDVKEYELDLSGCQFLNNGKLREILQAAKNLNALNLQLSDVNDEELARAIPYLKAASPHLESLNLGGVYYSKETLQKILENFPTLKRLNLDWIQRSCISEEEVTEIITPWIRNNANLECFESSYNDFSLQAILGFIDACPNTLKKFGMGFWAKIKSSKEFIQAMSELSKKCKESLIELRVDGSSESGENKADGIINNESFAMLPGLLPSLEILHVSCEGVSSSTVIRDAYLQWKRLKNFDGSSTSLIDADMEAILKKYSHLEALDLGWRKDNQMLIKVAPYLIENNASTLKHLSIFYPFDMKGVDAGLQSIEPLFSHLEFFEFGKGIEQLNDANLEWIISHLGEKITRFCLREKQTSVTNDCLISSILELAKRSPNLRELTLAGAILGIYDEPNGIPSAFKNLEYLNLSSLANRIEKDGIHAFIKHNPLLQTIDVGANLTLGDIEDLQQVEPRVGKSIKIIHR